MRKLNRIDIKHFSFSASVDRHLKEKACLRANIRFCRTVTCLTKRWLAGVLRPADAHGDHQRGGIFSHQYF
ncbi:hypothetical protein DGM85_23595 (plasmid) [Xanthomonas phaseoli pv. phaseoli]|nr:hypothetical protein DGN16_23870 [Xanthomonas citri pv. fuscans]QWN27175.1 hypothetical protein DGM93_23525 [Xanthomonas phaseoli pv. phaseoli]QWN10206.1 hypothetical protein DGN11_23040 [Xanthomonas citri pv. fuscans]QWN14409.1 hypothetical protein DGN07_23435 [Xanthomonas citri pv. fuscans]QWN31342.1 hypothetical protein DGM85_23595 [Xanthomonas phaseoli pv. phaseoli]